MDSATTRSVHPQMSEWSSELELAAQIADSLEVLNVNFVRVNSPRGTHIPDPRRVPRPGDIELTDAGEPAPKRMSTPAEIRAFFGGAVRYTPKAPTPAEGN